MLDTNKIPTSYLRDVARNIGWEDADGEPIPDRYIASIRQMDAYTFARRWSAWHLGDGGWGSIFADVIDTARAAEED